MERSFTYTKDRLRFIVQDILERDVLQSPPYKSDERAEEGFEKRAALEFVLWFLEQAFPDDFSFQCEFDKLETDYSPEIAERIVAGRGWSSRHVREADAEGNVVFVDFKTPR